MANQSVSASIVGVGTFTSSAKKREGESASIFGAGFFTVMLPTIVKGKVQTLPTAATDLPVPIPVKPVAVFPPRYSLKRSN